MPVKLLGEIADIGGGLAKNKKDISIGRSGPLPGVVNVLGAAADLREVAITAPVHRIEARLMPGVLMNEGEDKRNRARRGLARQSGLRTHREPHVPGSDRRSILS